MPIRQCGKKKFEILLLLGFYESTPNLDIIKNTLIRSIARYCDPDIIDRVVAITPQRHHATFSGIVGTLPFPVALGTYGEFLLSLGVAPMSDDSHHKPEIVEAYFSKVCATDYYLVLNETVFISGFINKNTYRDSRMPANAFESADGGAIPASESARREHANASDFSPIFVHSATARDLLSGSIGPESIASWRDLYWKTLKENQSRSKLYYDRKISSYFQSPPEMKSLFGGNNHSNPELFTIFSGLATNENTNKFVERRLTTKVGSTYEYIAEAAVEALLHEDVDVWQTSFGGVGSNYIARTLRLRGRPETYELLCHFPYPLPVQKPGFKAIYVFGDPELATISQLRKNHQINIAKNNNMNYNMPWCYEFTLEKYAEEQKDYFNLKEHFHNWTSPHGPLRHVSYPVLMLRFQTSMRYIPHIGKYLGLSDTERSGLKEKLVIKPRDSSSISEATSPAVVAIRRLYKDLAEEIEAFPDAAIWNPVTRSVEAL